MVPVFSVKSSTQTDMTQQHLVNAENGSTDLSSSAGCPDRSFRYILAVDVCSSLPLLKKIVWCKPDQNI